MGAHYHYATARRDVSVAHLSSIPILKTRCLMPHKICDKLQKRAHRRNRQEKYREVGIRSNEVEEDDECRRPYPKAPRTTKELVEYATGTVFGLSQPIRTSNLYTT